MKDGLTIKSKIPEQELVETLLNMKHSGVDRSYIILVFSLHCMANNWDGDKTIYYLNML